MESRPIDTDYVDFSWLNGWSSRASKLTEPLRARWSNDQLFGAAALVLAVALAVWMSSGAWGGQPAPGEDAMGHLVLSRFGVSHLFAHGRLDGWSPNFLLGFETYLFLGPGLALLTGLVHVLSLGLVSVTGAFKFVDIGSFLALPLAVAFVARSFGLSRQAAGIAGILTLAVNSPFGGAGVQGLFVVGLIPHQVGALFFFLTLGGVLRIVHAPRLRWTLFTAAAFAALVVVHARSVAMLLVFLGLIGALLVVERALWTVQRRTQDLVGERDVDARIQREVQKELARRGIPDDALEVPPAEVQAPPPPPILSIRVAKSLLTAAGLGLALSAFYLVPVLAHRDLQGSLAGWGAPPFSQRMQEVWRGDYLFRPHVAMIVAAGWVIAAGRILRRRPFALAVVAMPIVYLAFAHWADKKWPGNLITYQLPVRGLGYAAVLAVVPLAAAIPWVARFLGKAGWVAAIAGAAALVAFPAHPWRAVVKQRHTPVPAMYEAAAQLRKLVPDGARFATERDYPNEISRTGLINPDRWLAWASGRNTLNVFSIESSLSAGPPFETEHFDDHPPDDVASVMSRLGVTHVVAVSDAVDGRLRSSPRYRFVWRQEPLAIYAVLPSPGQPDPAALLTTDVPSSARLERAEAEHLRIAIEASAPARATIATGWSPKWHARLDGKPVAMGRDKDGLIEVQLPAGSHRLELDFRPDVWDYAGELVSAATLVGLGAWFVRWRRTARRPAPAPSTPQPVDQ